MSEQNGSWQPDPTGRHQYRWWNGTEWSDQVSDDGNVSSDPVDAGAAAAPTGASDQPISQEPEPTQTGWGGADATTSMPAAASSYQSTTTEPEKKSGSNTPVLIIGGVILLALIGAGAWFLLSGDDDELSRDDLIATVRDDLDLTRSEAECVVDEVGEDRLGTILGASADDVSSSDRDRLNTAVGECTGSGEGTSPTTEGPETTTTTEGPATTTTTTSSGGGGVPDPVLEAFVESMQSELNLTEAQARCFGEEFLSMDGLDLPGIAADPDTALADPALLTAMMNIFDDCDIDPASLVGGGGGSTGSGLSGLLPGQAYGDNPTLDALWDECEAGDSTACRDLYMHSEFGSEYEAFGQENM